MLCNAFAVGILKALRDVTILAISAGASSTAGTYTSEGKSGVIEGKRLKCEGHKISNAVHGKRGSDSRIVRGLSLHCIRCDHLSHSL